MTDTFENSQLLSQLKKLILSGKCVAHIGSGLSASIYPTWKSLIEGLCEYCEVPSRIGDGSKSQDFLDAAEESLKANPDKYYEYLGMTFGRNHNATNPLYRVLLQIPFKSYVTVNFDPLLANEARYPEINCNVERYPDLDRENIKQKTIYYIHGLIKRGEIPTPGSIVLSSSEFGSAYADSSPLMDFLRPTFKRDPICFMGCSLREPYLKRVFDICKKQQLEISNLGGGQPPPRFILLPNESSKPTTKRPDQTQNQEAINRKKTENDHYEGFDIRVVRYENSNDHHEGLQNLLETLAGIPEIPIRFGFDSEDY